jgi:PAS domain S-box-containing protein
MPLQHDPELETDNNSALVTALLEAAVDAVILADGRGRMIRVNRAATVMFGHDARDMVGANLSTLMPEPHASNHDDYIARHLATGETKIIGVGRDLEGVRKDGSLFPLHLSVGKTVLNDKVLFVGLVHDLSRRKAAERALEQSQRMEALGQLTGGVAHDFNNILTVITGNLELLDAKLESIEQRGILRDALEAAELGADITAKLLSLARKGTLLPQRLDVNLQLGELLALLRRSVGARVRLRTSLAPDIWTINVDPTQLQTALINLSVNARDAMPDGGDLMIETCNVAVDDGYIAQEAHIERGDYVRISVTDSGEGMSPRVQNRAFEPFFTTKPVGKGTGLGLSMVYGFARQSGGYVTIYSEQGFGTTVSLYFPALHETGVPMPEAGKAETDTAAPDHGRRILVVEDDPAVRRLSQARLKALGYRTLVASNADEALEVLAKHPDIDLLFSDVVMPGKMTGIDLARMVRKMRADLPILLTSGFSAGGDNSLIDAEFSLLQKPYRQADLATRLRIVLAGGKYRRS